VAARLLSGRPKEPGFNTYVLGYLPGKATPGLDASRNKQGD
jgi:hypothetical protein